MAVVAARVVSRQGWTRELFRLWHGLQGDSGVSEGPSARVRLSRLGAPESMTTGAGDSSKKGRPGSALGDFPWSHTGIAMPCEFLEEGP